MYNRYIPQSDGSYRRSRIPDIPQTPQRPPRPPEPEPEYCPPEPQPRCDQCPNHPPVHRPQNRPPRLPEQAGSFLKGLLPQGLDTEDLLIVLLLLLMSGECREDRNLPLLTLALYLFL